MFVNNWIAGTIELTSKVRYGLNSRGVPIFRFTPYDKRFSPMAVGCSQRNLFYNIHAIVEPTNQPTRQGELPKATIIQTLGKPCEESELKVLLATYAHDSLKNMRHFPEDLAPGPQVPIQRLTLEARTFHIDPAGCKDVDDSFTVIYDPVPQRWMIAINIADVSSFVKEGSALDQEAARRATSFYTPKGDAIQPMFPRRLSEAAFSLLPGEPKPTLSLMMTLNPTTYKPESTQWLLTTTETSTSYTYEEAQDALAHNTELQVLQKAAAALGAPSAQDPDTHTIVERMMIFYNQEAGKMLAAANRGVLRRHKAHAETQQIPGVPEFLAYESAEFCLPTDADTVHHGLGSQAYAYASSPIRRYADLLNQRAIKSLLHNSPSSPLEQEVVIDLNRRQKQAKAFQRDLFFMTNLAQAAEQASPSVTGTVVSTDAEKKKARIWVPAWKTTIKAKSLEAMKYEPGQQVSIQWYEDRGAARWKEKIVFKLSDQ